MINNDELSQGLMDELAAAEGGLNRLRYGGGVLVVFLVVYFQFMYGQFASMAEPEGLADIGVMMIEDHANQVAAMEAQIRKLNADFARAQSKLQVR